MNAVSTLYVIISIAACELMKQDWLGALSVWLTQISPYQIVYTGIYSSISLSVIGAGAGIMMIGASLTQATVHHPEIRSKNLISILFCEAIALYGIIMSIILFSATGKSYTTILLRYSPYSGPDYYDYELIDRDIYNLYAGYGIGLGGLTVGLCNFAAALTVGILGSTVTVSNSNQSSVFVRLFIAEVFAEAIALIGLIAGIVMSINAKFV